MIRTGEELQDWDSCERTTSIKENDIFTVLLFKGQIKWGDLSGASVSAAT